MGQELFTNVSSTIPWGAGGADSEGATPYAPISIVPIYQTRFQGGAQPQPIFFGQAQIQSLFPRALPLQPSADFSRADAIAQISTSRSWAELFESGNKALAFDRSKWGDDFPQSVAALALWQRCAFIIEAKSPIEMGKRMDGLALFCDPMDAKRASFDAAKSMLAHLAAPLPASPASARASTSLHASVLAIEAEIQGHMAALGAKAKKIEVLQANPTPKGEEMNFLTGTAAWVAMSKVDELISKPFMEACEDWPGLARLGGADSASKSDWASRLDRSEIELAWRDLLDAGHFAYVACGPMGGLAQGASEARSITRAARSMSAEIAELGMPSVGLGGLGVSVNASPIGMYATGAFEAYRFDLVFKAPFRATALHHEWTHALERMGRKSGDQAAASAWDAFQQASHGLAQDPLAFQGELQYSQGEILGGQKSLLRSLAKLAKPALLGCSRRGAVLGAIAELDLIAKLGAAQPKWDRANALSILSSHGLFSGSEVPQEISLGIGKLCAVHAFDAELNLAWRQGSSSFVSVAKALDKASGVDSGYWRDASELHARCGEARFASLVPEAERTAAGRLIVGSYVATSHPMGAERSEVSKAYDSMMVACVPMVMAAVEERKRIAIDLWRGRLASQPAWPQQVQEAPRQMMAA